MIEVVCALILREGRVLLAQRPAGKHLAMKWEFPGGKVESHETAETAISREIREELGCEVRVVRALKQSVHVYERGPILMIPFVCELMESSAEPVTHEHMALAWARPEEIRNYDLAPADWPVVDAFLSSLGAD